MKRVRRNFVQAVLSSEMMVSDDFRQTHLIKKAIDVNQTYLITPHKTECNPKDPVAFVKRAIEQENQDVGCAIFKFLEFAKSQGMQLQNVSEYQRQGE